MTTSSHWDAVHGRGVGDAVSWFEAVPVVSLALVDQIQPAPASVVDVGAGSSRFADHLLQRGFDDVTVLDVSGAALEAVRRRVGGGVASIVADVTTWTPQRRFDLWHDRAAFHFLTDPAQRADYRLRLRRALRPGGHVIIGTFGLEGPERCSGLPVKRYSARTLHAALGPDAFVMVDTRSVLHRTPWGTGQAFQFSLFRHLG
jgi:SAM-dependent methyltransferase